MKCLVIFIIDGEKQGCIILGLGITLCDRLRACRVQPIAERILTRIMILRQKNIIRKVPVSKISILGSGKEVNRVAYTVWVVRYMKTDKLLKEQCIRFRSCKRTMIMCNIPR